VESVSVVSRPVLILPLRWSLREHVLASSECGVTPDHAGLATALLYPGAARTLKNESGSTSLTSNLRRRSLPVSTIFLHFGPSVAGRRSFLASRHSIPQEAIQLRDWKDQVAR
jgi:hypothetical protein